MPTTPLPAAIRKRTDIFAKNVKHRGNVKKSLDPKKQQSIEAERLRKKGLGSGLPSLSSGSRKIILIFLALTVGSVLYQICLPFIGGRSSNNGASPREAKQSSSALTREQQARAAEAVLQELNKKATEKYFSMAKNYKPPVQPMVDQDNADVDDFVDFEEAARKYVLDNHGSEDDMPFDAANDAQGPVV